MCAAVTPPNDVDDQAGPYRVMVVDDSAVIRGFITRFLEEDRAIKVIASAANGQMAVRNIPVYKPEVVLLDIEMPVMDGLTALPQILKAAPDTQVVMASTLTRANAEISLKALNLGAVDYVPKPESNREVNSNIDFRREITEKVRAYGAARRKARGEALPGEGSSPSSFRGRQPVGYARPAAERAPAAARAVTPAATAAKPAQVVSLRPPSRHRPDILVIGASTGGPQALIKLFTHLPEVKRLPILIVQHMPATFTSILADHLARASGLAAAEGQSGQTLAPGQIYVAPGDYHMVLDGDARAPSVKINQDPPENYCRPAVDPLFRSAAKLYGPRVLSVILTGMGHDGLRGGREIVAAGGTLLAQDEASSVVWGMPGAVATAGLCSQVLPLDEMPAAVGRMLRGSG